MAEQAQHEEAETQVAEMLSNDAKFWRDQASWEATGGLQSSGDVGLASEKVSCFVSASLSSLVTIQKHSCQSSLLDESLLVKAPAWASNALLRDSNVSMPQS